MTEQSERETSKISSVFSISHEKDVDGLLSAVIVSRYASSKGLKYGATLTDYGLFESVFPKSSSMRNTLIVVTDLGLDEHSIDIVVSSLKKAIAQGCRIVWLDHHDWPDRAVKSVLSLDNNPRLTVNPEFCASEIAFKVLMPRDEVSAELARIAHDTDFNTRAIESANALTDALSLLRFAATDKGQDFTEAITPIMRSLADKGIAGIWDEDTKRFRDNLLSQRVDSYRKEKIKKMRKALSGRSDLEINGSLVRIVEIPNGVTTTDMGTWASDERNLKVGDEQLPVADMLVTLSPNGLLGFRRGQDKILCNVAARLFKGGGHPYAAGGEYGMYHDFQAACDDIFTTLSKSKDWVVTQENGSSRGHG
jgi:oligoribonuclease NrnB/cAMP/cGMP phosphodiesterase (DHH superfamily)